MTRPDHDRARLRAARLSLVGAVVVLVLKVIAWLATGSVGLASDAAESTVNVVAGFTLLLALRLARTPPDYEHPYGHEKVEDLSSAFEAALILGAAMLIAGTAVGRLIDPRPLDRMQVGLGVAAASAALNAGLGAWLWREGRRLRSVALRTNARHLGTDVLTSVGVITGVAAVGLTGALRLDPLIALVVAAHIAVQGVRVLQRSVSQLMDERLPPDEEARVIGALEGHPEVLGYHRLRSRRAGRARFVEVDVFVAPTMPVAEAHALVERVEDEIHRALPNMVSTVHVEPFVPGVREGATAPRDEYPPD